MTRAPNTSIPPVPTPASSRLANPRVAASLPASLIERDRMLALESDPDSLTAEAPPLAALIEAARGQNQLDLAASAGRVEPSDAVMRKLPIANCEWRWQQAFPPTRLDAHPGTGHCRRHHRHETVVQPAVRRAVLASGIPKRAKCHAFRRSFATLLPESGSDIRTVQESLGHKNVATTMIYSHVLDRGPAGVQRPADRLLGDLP